MLSMVAVEGIGEPRPGNLCQECIGGHFEVDLRSREGDHPQSTLPRLIPDRIVQQDEATAAQFLVIIDDVGLYGRGERSDPLGGGHALHLDLGSPGEIVQLGGEHRERLGGIGRQWGSHALKAMQ